MHFELSLLCYGAVLDPRGGMGPIMKSIFSVYWMNAVSRLVGALADFKAPAGLRQLLLKAFAGIFRIHTEEAEKPIGDYESISEFFARALKPGSRSIQGPICSPADGTLSQCAPAKWNEAVQAKGIYYSLPDLVASDEPGETFAQSATVYLAPHNYHRVHVPIEGELEAITYIPGELWPVNQPFVKWTPRLFVRNERLIFKIRDRQTNGLCYAVMVGALNVGRMSTPYWDGFLTNQKSPEAQRQDRIFDQPIPVAIGDHLGTFMLGSTVVLVFDETCAKAYKFTRIKDPKPISMGESIAVPAVADS